MPARFEAGQLAKGEQCGEWAGVDSGRSGIQTELRPAQPLGSIAEAESEMLQGFEPLGAQQGLLGAAALMDQPLEARYSGVEWKPRQGAGPKGGFCERVDETA